MIQLKDGLDYKELLMIMKTMLVIRFKLFFWLYVIAEIASAPCCARSCQSHQPHWPQCSCPQHFFHACHSQQC